MKPSIQGTQTEKNLEEAFIAEATSAIKYKLFAEESEFEVIEEKFEDIAEQEIEHANVFLKLLGGLNDDLQNLQNSIALEGFASTVDYPDAARVADEEGFAEIAQLFRDISTIEARHKKTFELFFKECKEGSVLKKPTKQRWLCLECGFIVDGLEAPKECPVCHHEQSDFKIYKEGD